MKQAKRRKATVPENRIGGYFEKPGPRVEWMSFLQPEGGIPGLFLITTCPHGYIIEANIGEESGHEGEVPNWTELARKLVARLPLEKRVENTEHELKNLSVRLTRIEELCEKGFQKPICVPISTFAPEPFEVVRPFSVIVQFIDDSYTSSFVEANISSSGDTQHEAVENLKDLILMVFQDFEGEDDDSLGPAMLKQKKVLFDVIRRKQ